MERRRAVSLMGVLLLLMGAGSFAQSGKRIPSTIEPHAIALSYYQTTNLIFPYAIKSVDRGSGAVIVQKAKGVDNILQTKAAKKGFEPTNLSVVTADGKFYSFLLYYEDAPEHLTLNFSGGDPVQFANDAVNAKQLEQESWQVRGMYRFMGIQRKRQEMRLQLGGIWLSDNTMWYKLNLANRSQVDFRTDYVRFFLRDRKRSKRTAVQETEVFPVYVAATEKVGGLAQAQWIIGFMPFTVPPEKKLIIQVGEKGNGRTVVLPLKSTVVLRAKRL